MSLTITVKDKTLTLPAQGDNGNQEIDTKAEAEAALAYLPEGSTDSVTVVGGRPYTRAQLIEIRDRAPKGEDKPAGAAVAGEAVAGEGVSHGVALEGRGTGDKGSVGHGETGARLTYRLGIPLLGGEQKLKLDVIGGGDLAHGTRDFSTPGGEAVKSAFTSYGFVLGADARFVPSLLSHRLFAALGFRAGVGGFGTADSDTVSTPGKCVPGDFGRADCEPTAGPRVGNAGTAGLWNPRVESARGTAGMYAGLEFPLTLGGTVFRGDWGSVDLFGGVLYSLKKLMPSDGDGFSFSSFGGFGGVAGRFGGSDAYVSDSDGDGVPNDKDKCPETARGDSVNADGCSSAQLNPTPAPVTPPPPVTAPTYAAKVTDSSPSVKPEGRFAVGVDVSAKSEITVQFKDAAGKLYNAGSANVEKGQSVSEFRAPSTLAAGKYKLVVAMKDPETKVEKVEEREITIVERVEWTVPGSFAPGQPPAAQDVRVVGQPKLEGVSYVIVAVDKEGKEVGQIKVADKPGTIEDKKGTRIAFKAPDINGKSVGWQKDINYRVTLVNKDGHLLDVKSFEIGQAPAPKGGGGKKRV